MWFLPKRPKQLVVGGGGYKKYFRCDGCSVIEPLAGICSACGSREMSAIIARRLDYWCGVDCMHVSWQDRGGDLLTPVDLEKYKLP